MYLDFFEEQAERQADIERDLSFDSRPALGYLPPPQCGQCEYFRQGKHAIATGAEYGFCDLQDLERHQSAQPCGLFVSAIPF